MRETAEFTIGFVKYKHTNQYKHKIVQIFKKLYLEKGLLLLLEPNIVVPALPNWGLSLSQLAGGSFRSVFSCRRA